MGSSVFIYLTADDVTENSLVREFENSKVYRHELEAYGGKLSVVSNEIIRWFEGLWQGRSLAFTVAAITFIAALGVFIVACGMPHDVTSDTPREDDGDES
jgi:hypothetical protein